jgi:hypothetical protein
VLPEGLGKFKKKRHIGYRPRDLPVCSYRHILKNNILWQNATNFLCARSNLLEQVIRPEFPDNRSILRLHLTKAKHSINKLRMVQNEIVSVRIDCNNFIAGENKKQNQCDNENYVYKQCVNPDP